MRRLIETLVVTGTLWTGSAVVAGAADGAGTAEIPTKQVAAPASDIINGTVVLPEPEDLGVVSRTALLPVSVRRGRATTIGVPPGSRAVLMPAIDGAWSVGLESPTGLIAGVDRAEQLGVRRAEGGGGWIAPDRVFTRLEIPAGQHDGMWTLRIASDRASAGFVLVEPPTDVELYTYQTGLAALVGSGVSLRSEFSHGGTIDAVTAHVRTPSGDELAISSRPGDPDVRFVPDEPGEYAVRVHAAGRDADGRSVELTSQHLVHAERAAPAFGAAAAFERSGSIEISLRDGLAGRRSIVAAEVWGLRDSVSVPVCWLAQICGQERTLSLDPRWIALEGVDPGSLMLRHVRAHDVDSMTMVAYEETVVIADGLRGLTAPGAQESITPGMLQGEPGRTRVSAPVGSGGPRMAGPGHRLMLIHGYCSGGNPFTTSHFSGDVAVFSDTDQNRSHDQFALQILSQSAPMKSFGVAAHSQGAMAALHLSTFYWSGMDWAKGDRLIQSVGAPYQGTALAGNAAVLGDLFGSGCGSNNDMTYAGSAQWLSTIPSWARANVWYWTTSFEDRPFAFDYCNIISDLLLSDPDDGVIEQSGGQLPGATNRGHREGWCHTTGMRDPAQCTDASRNSEISLRARR